MGVEVKGSDCCSVMINAQDEQGSELLIGVSHDGIASYKDKLVLNKFPW